MMAVVSNNGFLLKCASDELKSDKAIVLAAVKNRGSYASDELKTNEEIRLAAKI
jgi:hypothetical protein